MKKNLLFASLILACLFPLAASAQEADSGYLNLGRVRLKKEFTQTFSIKPGYLEKMPFANLTDAINAWLYGNFSNTATTVYIVDGNIAPDVNMYSIYDIEEITLVQNAVVQLNGAAGQAQLIVITTKRKRQGKPGLDIAGQLFMVNNTLKNQQHNPANSSDNNLYHQYNISAYQDKEKIQYGASINFMRDVFPVVKADSLHTGTPENIKRFRLNAYLHAQLGKQNELFLHLGYAPQAVAFDQQSEQLAYSEKFSINQHVNENLLAPSLRLHTKLSKAWSNDFIGGYDEYNSHGSTNAVQTYILSPNPEPYITTTKYTATGRLSTLFVGDQLRYAGRIGGLQIEPSLDFRFSKRRASSTIHNDVTNNTGSYQFITDSIYSKGNIYLLTPSVTVSYKHAFSMHAGLLEILNALKNSPYKKTYPFVSASANILKTSAGEHTNSLMVFGSYSKSADFGDPAYPLEDFSLSPAYKSSNLTTGFGTLPYYYPYQIDMNTWIAEGGATWTALQGRLYMSYNYERRSFNDATEIYLPFGGNGGIIQLIQRLVASSTHRLAINMRVVEKKNVDWFTGITGTVLSINKGVYNNFPVEYATGDYNAKKPSFTGGWVNRVSYKRFLFGLDVVYHINEQVLMPVNFGLQTETHKNALLLQNIYVGYTVKNMELYIAVRNLMQSQTEYITNGNRYYGIGFKKSFF